jgi:hypothetical protein
LSDKDLKLKSECKGSVKGVHVLNDRDLKLKQGVSKGVQGLKGLRSGVKK